MSLLPVLTDHDRAVLDATPVRRARRADDIARAARVPAVEARATLRGLQHLGCATCRNGWWQRTPLGTHVLTTSRTAHHHPTEQGALL